MACGQSIPFIGSRLHHESFNYIISPLLDIEEYLIKHSTLSINHLIARKPRFKKHKRQEAFHSFRFPNRAVDAI